MTRKSSSDSAGARISRAWEAVWPTLFAAAIAPEKWVAKIRALASPTPSVFAVFDGLICLVLRRFWAAKRSFAGASVRNSL